MNASGNIVVSWPYEDFDFARFLRIRPLLFAHGFNAMAVTSSSFVLFSGTQDSADELKRQIAEVDPGFAVTWEPKK